MWIYNQANGILSHDGLQVATGYSGHGRGLNNPKLEQGHMVGPIPRGVWRIGDAVETTTHGPTVLVLTPDADTETFGRCGFLIHGDRINQAGEHMASYGCIILPHEIRLLINASKDRTLGVF